MIDPSLFRTKEGLDLIRKSLVKRFFSPEILDKIVAIDKKRRDLIQTLNKLQNKRNSESKRIGDLKSQKNSEEFEKSRIEIGKIGEQIKELKINEKEIEAELLQLALQVPNLLDAQVPEGRDEKENKTVKIEGNPDKINQAKPHYEVLEQENQIDPDRGAKLAGSRFLVYNDKLAALERRLSNWMIEIHRSNGFEERQVPILVTDEAMQGTGQYPKFADDYYRIEKDDLNLIPTAEVPVTNLYSNEIIPENLLPLNLTALTPCFRREAGSAGKDVRGMIRVHQFYKVELVKICHPEKSAEELDKLLLAAESILKKLGIVYRVQLLCSGDIGFSPSMTYDLEMWMPGLQRWLEVSSVSNFQDFQSRRSKIRTKTNEGNKLVHTLNGSGVAAGRLVAALTEYYQEDGQILWEKIFKLL